MANDKYSMIRSMKLASFLMYHGFKLINVSPNKRHPDKMVFWFENCEDLVLAIIDYNKAKEMRTKNDGDESWRDKETLCRRGA